MTRFHQSRCVLYSQNFVVCMRVLIFLQLSNFSIFIIHYHLRSVSNFALSKLEPGADFFNHPSLDILHNLEAAESRKYAACVFIFCSSPRYLARCRSDGTYPLSEIIPSSM